ncbi:acyltransferase family protein [Oleomonas cavernae]|uniref:Acyltransferase family protein n=1 Tax=Oleomonas cavernae TaxID=2320859 RepID=A0A418WHT3_9PROT|nr:lysophospholipid acyltransferase family protein [Oleomonas cavernae]RJF89583.1 acyltransferase family protein [Oleomonas cavernae]
MTDAAPPVAPFTDEDYAKLRKRLGPAIDSWTALTDPVFEGLENVPLQGPALFIGNHTLMGTLDASVMTFGLKERTGVWLRGLADNVHFKVPYWRELFLGSGAVAGNPDNFRALMALGAHVIVFPGGVGEVFKRKGEQYKLRWKERLGFARLAIEAGCPVIPFSAVGADDSYSILLGSDEIMKVPGVASLTRRLGLKPDYLGLYRGLGLTALPRPERYYFRFAPAIDTSRWHGEVNDDNAWALRREVEAAIGDGLDLLLAQRENDPKRKFRNRLLPLAGRLARRLQS